MLDSKIAKALTQADIAKFQADVAAGKSRVDIKDYEARARHRRGRPRHRSALARGPRRMLQFAVRRKLIPANPAKSVRLFKGEKKERFLSEAEVARLADALAAMEREHRLNARAAAAVRLLLLTGCRKSEILSLRWEWLDFERGCLRLPDSKTGQRWCLSLPRHWSC